MTLILTAGIFLIMLTVMTLQGFLMYLYWKIFYQADIPIPQFWRPIPLLAVLSAVVGARPHRPALKPHPPQDPSAT
ncbi:MAG: hypothetical protein ACLTW9_25505 [Enterocloster sp.]